MTSQDVVISKIKKISPNIPEINEESLDYALTGSYFNFSGRELTYLLLELSEYMQVKFVKEDVENYSFNSIRKIAEIIDNKLVLGGR